MQQLTNPNRELFWGTSGPKDAAILIVGEAWGQYEAQVSAPFVGPSGMEFNKMLHEAGLEPSWQKRSKVLCTNVCSEQPPRNDFTYFLRETPRKKAEKDALGFRGIYPTPLLRKHLDRLYALIALVQPKLIIAAGNWPLWALTDHASCETKKGFKLPAGIQTWRGSQTFSIPIGGRTYPVLPIIHPAAILREWGLRSITVHDLRSRAARFINGSLSWQAPELSTISKPSFAEAISLLNSWIAICHRTSLPLACDLETYRRKYISVVGLADASCELVLPFFSFTENGLYQPYWSPEEELEIFSRLRSLLEHPNCKIIGQNFTYDTQWFFRYYNIEAIVTFDTMVAQHLLFPGVPKSLDYIASLYCNHYCYWKDESEDWDSDALSAEQLWQYNGKDLRATYESAMLLQRLITSRKKQDQYDFLMESWKLAREMTLRGTRADIAERDRQLNDLRMQIASREQWLMSCVPEGHNRTKAGQPYFTSAHALKELFYDKLLLPPRFNKITKKPTTDDSALQDLAEDFPHFAPWLDTISEWRSMQKFEDFLMAKEGVTNRYHPQFNVAQPETFRWSSSKNGFGEALNGQNIPKVED